MNKSEIIIQLLLSLNRGNTGSSCFRVGTAIEQYQELVDKGIITEDNQDERQC